MGVKGFARVGWVRAGGVGGAGWVLAGESRRWDALVSPLKDRCGRGVWEEWGEVVCHRETHGTAAENKQTKGALGQTLPDPPTGLHAHPQNV